MNSLGFCIARCAPTIVSCAPLRIASGSKLAISALISAMPFPTLSFFDIFGDEGETQTWRGFVVCRFALESDVVHSHLLYSQSPLPILIVEQPIVAKL